MASKDKSSSMRLETCVFKEGGSNAYTVPHCKHPSHILPTC